MASIVVVGGGLAGLTCAWRLQRAGHDVEVLERERDAGGRIRSERHGEFTVEAGAQFVAGGYRNLHAVTRTLGIDQQLLPHAPARDAVLHAGKLQAVDFSTPLRLLTSPLLGARGVWGLARVAALVLRQRHRLDPLRPELAAGLDGEDMVTGLRPLLGAEVFDTLVAPTFAATFDEEPEHLSLAFALLMLRLFASGLTLRSFAGGNALLTDTLARQLPVLTGCEVGTVETETDGARVRYSRMGRESSVYADAVVVAVPGSRVAALCPKLVPEERGFFEEVRYTRGIIAHLLLDDAPRSLPYGGAAFPRSEGLDLYGIAVAHHKAGAAPPGAGSINAALTAQACDRMWREPDAEIGALVRENLERTPVGALGAGSTVVHRWTDMLPRFAPGYLKRLAAFQRRLERSPRMVFAGDYLVGPTTEGALTSGMRAATEIARML